MGRWRRVAGESADVGVSLGFVGTALAIAFVAVCVVIALGLLKVAWSVYRGPRG